MIISKKAAALPSSLGEYVVNMSEGETDELRVLVYVLACDGEINTDDMASALGMDETDVISAVSFWRGAGLIAVKGKTSATERKNAVKKESSDAAKDSSEPASGTTEKLANSVRDTESRSYTSEEVARIISSGSEIQSLRDYVQQRLGKILSAADDASLVRLIDYILLTPEMIMLIVEYCVENGKNSMRYVEKTAISIYDEGVRDYEALVAYFDRKKAAKSNEGLVRRIIGSGERSFTSKEREHISNWFEWFSENREELITYAYEKTIANISKPSIPYMSKLLELWHSKGYKSVADVENGRISDKASSRIDLDAFDEASNSGVAAGANNTAFNLDDFFENS